jgi:hypothetical protein
LTLSNSAAAAAGGAPDGAASASAACGVLAGVPSDALAVAASGMAAGGAGDALGTLGALGGGVLGSAAGPGGAAATLAGGKLLADPAAALAAATGGGLAGAAAGARAAVADALAGATGGAAASPSGASLWGALAPRALPGGLGRGGASAALSALSGGGFDGFSAEGFHDLGALGLDYSLGVSAAGALSGTVEAAAELPLPPPPGASGPLRWTQRLAVSQNRRGAPTAVDAVAATLSAPVAGGAGVARVRLARGRDGAPALALSLGQRGDAAAEATSGAARPKGAAAARRGCGGGGGAAADSDGSDDERENAPRAGGQLPRLNLELHPARGTALSWRQAWGGALRSSASFRSGPGRLALSARARPAAELHARGELAVDGLGPCAAPPSLSEVAAVLAWRPRRAGAGAPRRLVQLRSAFAPPTGASHALRVRQRGGAGAKAGFELKLHPHHGRAGLKVELELTF